MIRCIDCETLTDWYIRGRCFECHQLDLEAEAELEAKASAAAELDDQAPDLLAELGTGTMDLILCCPVEYQDNECDDEGPPSE